ncbi:hypothetical protein G9F72_006435 [Clostridium estertheticum]|uniref:hypothetical protein n=1 Tax=Clostridium estertheticum TaxID=238834 RepID=UPI0013E98E45|nr:hypothetical protein [Clostridium estertheticum]MBZ9685971.1 hypothetical protein [Clostridium estertheticum]
MKLGEILKKSMMDTSGEDDNREWCYLAKSTTTIGVPFQPDVTQVTFDGALFTKNAELCFFYGKSLKPIFARQKTFYKGWIPIVRYDWIDESLCYDIEMFASKIMGEDESNTLNFVRITIENKGVNLEKAVFASAMRNTGKDYRFQGLDYSTGEYIKMEFSKDWMYAIHDNKAIRNNKVVYTFSSYSYNESIPGKLYVGEFCGKEYDIREESAVCISHYEKELNPGEKIALIFKMPRVPVGLSETEFIEKIEKADYDFYRNETICYWENMMNQGASFSFPEKRVQEAQLASLVHLLLATRSRDGERFQTSGLAYPNFFMIDFLDMRLAYELKGWHSLARMSFDQIFKRQMDDGLFCDTSLSHGKKLWTSHGHMIYTLAHHCLITRDFNYAREIYQSIKDAVKWIEMARKENEYGLMPPTYPYDAEMINGHYTSHNLLSILGLRAAICLSRELEMEEDANEWKKLHDEYLNSLISAINATCGDDGYIPPGLYSYLTGKAAKEEFEEFQTNCDWENILLVYPTEILEPGDKRVEATLSKMRKGYAEGVMTYRHGMFLHQYITTNLIEQYIVLGQSKKALIDLYNVLVHCGSTHEGFENLVFPWTDRHVDPTCPTPHAWAAAKVALLLRNMLVLEYGGDSGLESKNRDLYLFSVISPEWAKDNQEISFKNAPTEMGNVSARMIFTNTGAHIEICNEFHKLPAAIKIRIPYFKEFIDCSTDATKWELDGDCISLSPDVSFVNVAWKEKEEANLNTFEELLLGYRSSNSFTGVDKKGCPIIKEGEPFITDDEKREEVQILNFKLVLEAFKHEYNRRCNEFLNNCGTLKKVKAPEMSIDNSSE